MAAEQGEGDGLPGLGPDTPTGPTGPDQPDVQETDLNDLSPDDLDFADLRAEDLDYEFEDLSHEQERTYQFDNHVLTIEDPVALNTTGSGSHKVLDSRGVSYDIYPKWNYIAWKSEEGTPHFTEN